MKIRQGQTTERDTQRAAARIGFDELGGAVTGKLQVLFPSAGGWNFFYTPKPGDHTVAALGDSGEGYVLGKVYTAGKMPQGGAPNIILLVSDDGKNVIRLDADKGKLEVLIDQTGDLNFKNLNFKVKEHTGLTTNDLDIKSDKPIGFQGTNTELGADFLQIFFDDLIDAVTRNPLIIPPVPLPKGAPVPPAPPLINMFLNGIVADIVTAATKAKTNCAKALK